MSRGSGIGACLIVVVLAALAASARAEAPLPRSFDELADAAVDTRHHYRLEVLPPIWIVPGRGLPPDLDLGPSNNNVALAYHGGRLFLAWRSSQTHFASRDSRIHVISTSPPGGAWRRETTIALQRDVREPFLLSVGPRFFLYFAELGAEAHSFEPEALWRMERLADGRWSEKERWGGRQEVAWDFKVRRGRVWMTSYRGDRYRASRPNVELRFRWSADGITWQDPPAPGATVYRGGVSEAAFEFDDAGKLWAVTRNEDGDASGYGSHLVTAPADRPWEWRFPERSNPRRYDSPRLFRHGRDLYLIARRDPQADFDDGCAYCPGPMRRLALLARYSMRPKKTTVYRVDTERQRLIPLVDLPSAGDTAFPSIVRLGPDALLVANYTSPLDMENAPWLAGQISPRGTAIYISLLRFVKD